MTKPEKAELDGEALLDIHIEGPHEVRTFEDGSGALVRRLDPVAGGECIWAGQGVFQPLNGMNQPSAPPLTFWFRITGVANAADAFAKMRDHLEAAGPVFAKRLQESVRKAQRQIVAPQSRFRLHGGGNGDRLRMQ